MISIPKALPPVTQSSAFQAPKRFEVLYDATSLLTGHMPHMALRCLEGSTLSNLVHRLRRCARIVPIWYCCLEGSTPEDGVYPCLSPCDGCKNPVGVMVWLAENIQACLRIFRRAQHQWLARDILHQAQGFFYVFVLWPG